MTRPSFSKERVTNFDIFDRHANDAVEQSAARLAAGYPIDFHVGFVSFGPITVLINHRCVTIVRIWCLASRLTQPRSSYLATMSVHYPPVFPILDHLPVPTPMIS